MNDRELLELAAKAIGFGTLDRMTGAAQPDGTRIFYKDCEGKTWRTWNPLTDDGDALRLAVDLNIIISYSVDCTVAYAKRFDIPDQSEWTVGVHGEPEYGLPDMPEAVRRAIVRAAAAIGEAMQ